MSRRVTLPGADELFRSTASSTAADPAVPEPPPATAIPAAAAPALVTRVDADVTDSDEEQFAAAPVRRRPRPVGERRPSGRERHEEKITVYCSAEELIDIERARLTLCGEYGLAADRGRIVREALAVVLADLETKGDQSVLVRRLRTR